MMPVVPSMLRRVLSVALVLAASAPSLSWAQGLASMGLNQDSGNQAQEQLDPKKLNSSLNDVIQTLENSRKRKALVAQLKQLRDATGTEAKRRDSTSITTSNGLLGGLSDWLADLSRRAEQGHTPLAVWRQHAKRATADAHRLFAGTSQRELIHNLGETAIGLAFWLSAISALTFAGRRLYRARGWPLRLPPGPRPWMLIAHFLRRIFPWLVTFAALLGGVRLFPASTPTSTALLVVAYVALCGRLLSTVFDIVIALFTRGHRRTAVKILHDKALVPLFVIGVLVAFGDAVNSGRLLDLLGYSLANLLSVIANTLAGLLGAVLIVRIRRPAEHLMKNRSLRNRQNRGGLGELIPIAAKLWHVPALLLVAASLAAIFFTGGRAHTAFAQAMICMVLLVLALVITGLIRRQHERAVRRQHKSRYAARFRRLGFALAQGLVWLIYAELSVRVWGVSLFGIGQRGAISAKIGHALLGLGLTVVIAWLVWIVIDTAIDRALRGRRADGRPRDTSRAQTITPMVRDITLFTIIIIAAIVGLANLGVNVTPLLAGAGIIGIALGFGAQTLVADLITGIFILIEDSLAIGDFVEINGFMGSVEGLNLRAVRLRDLDGVVHITTFSHIDAIHNMSRQFGIALLKIRIPHDLRIDDAVELMRRTASDLHRDPFMRGLIRSHLEMQGIHEFDNGCPILRMRLRTAPEYQWDVSRAFNLALKRRMETEYITLGAPRLSVSTEAGGGTRHDKRGKTSRDDSATTVDWPTDNQPSPDPG